MHQLHRYQRQAPLMLAPNVFCVAADEDEFRYGTVLFHDASKDDIERHLDTWGPLAEPLPGAARAGGTRPDAAEPDDPLEVPVKGPAASASPRTSSTSCSTSLSSRPRRARRSKKIARYQQFEAVNDLVDRTVSLVGQPVDAQDRTGLIWHTQGSGKSLTMVFAGQKLRRHPALSNPTVLIVVDRRDLKTQLSDDFDACDYPNVEKALGVEDLKTKLRSGLARHAGHDHPVLPEDGRSRRRSRATTSSAWSTSATARRRANGAESYAMTMRVKLPNGFRFGFTGTPIDRTMQNTHRDFGPLKDGVQERYLSYYGIRRAIKDGATLEVHYIRDQVPFKVDEKPLSVGFEQMCEEMELEDEEAKDFIQRQRSQWKELARHPDRIEIVLDKMLEHFLEHPDPNGFKAQLVAVDRKACALYKNALDAKLKARGLPPEWSDVIISGGAEQRARDRALRVRQERSRTI